jgi:hypothetical protein
MKVSGSRTSMKSVPLTSTTTENSRPASEWKTTSPKPSVDMVTSVQ